MTPEQRYKQQIRVLGDLLANWEKYPHLRLGQFLLNALNDNKLYYCEDSLLVDKLNRFYEEWI